MSKKSKSLKENPLMKDEKNIKRVRINSGEEESNEIKRFIIIVIIIFVLAIIIYFVTEKIQKNEVKEEENKVTINYDKVIVGTILNRPIDEYYVLVYDASKDDSVKYSVILNNYMMNSYSKDYIKIYECDLSNQLNKKYYNVNNDNISNPKAKTTEEFDFGDITLLKIKDGKLVEYLEDYQQILEKLK